jgi:hypothetical protein
MANPIDVQALASEVANSNFDDERLNRRLGLLVSRLSADPSLSLPKAFDSAELEAAYRFFSNHRVTADSILGPHVEATKARCQEAGDFLVVHDSTTFSYRHDGRRQGLGLIRPSSKNGKQAFHAHVSLALAADGTRYPLGVAALMTWVRGPKKTGTEYQRWENQIRLSSSRLDGQKHAIHVMDREADDYQMFHTIVRDGIRFVARALTDRCLESALHGDKLHAHLGRFSATAEREVPLSSRKKRSNPIATKIFPPRTARIAKLSVSAATVELKRPASRRKFKIPTLPSLSVNVVRVWEEETPAGEPAVEWFLYTTEPIETPEQQLAIVDHYRARWVIEEYFKAIKSSCDFESRQLEDYEGLVNLLATFAPVAYRLLLIRSEARRVPDASADTVLSPDQIDVLRARGRIKLGPVPSVRDVYLAIAALGGHLKRNGDPGYHTLSHGLQKLELMTEGWVAAKLQQRRDQ